MIRAALSLLLAAAALVALAPAAAAHFQENTRRWYFGGNTYGDAEATQRSDPVNMLFYPGFETQDQIHDHFDDHWGPNEPDEWFRHDEIDTPSTGLCRGDQYVNFRVGGPDSFRARPTDFHGAGTGRSQNECANRYHIRFWGDAYHEQQTGAAHTGSGRNRSWVLGGAHYEEILQERAGHAPALDWDTVEHRVVRYMRPHSYTIRWKCLPHSFGMYQGFRSDGRITRLSINHGSGVTNAGPEVNTC